MASLFSTEPKKRVLGKEEFERKLASLFSTVPRSEVEAFIKEQNRVLVDPKQLDAAMAHGAGRVEDSRIPPGQGQLKSYDAPWREDIAAAGSEFAGQFGLNEKKAYRNISRVLGITDFIPGLGDMAAGADSVEAFNRGNLLGGAGLAVLTGVGLLPIIGDGIQKGGKSLFREFAAKPGLPIEAGAQKRPERVGGSIGVMGTSPPGSPSQRRPAAATGTRTNRPTAILSREYTRLAAGSGELENIGTDAALNSRFAAEMEAAARSDRNPVFHALGMQQKPTVSATGYWNDPVHGLQSNPAYIDRPVVDLEPQLPQDRRGGMKPAGMAMSARDREAGLFTGRLFGLENAQHGVGFNLFMRGDSSHQLSQLNGIHISGRNANAARQLALKNGFDVADNADGGWVVTSFGRKSPEAIRAFGEQLRGVDGVKSRLGLYDSNYAASGLSVYNEALDQPIARPPGQGLATRELLEAADRLPNINNSLSAVHYPEHVRARNEVRRRIAGETGQQLRPDLEKLRHLLGADGLRSVREHVSRYGYEGLPGWMLGIIGAGSLITRPLQDPSGAERPE